MIVRTKTSVSEIIDGSPAAPGLTLTLTLLLLITGIRIRSNMASNGWPTRDSRGSRGWLLPGLHLPA